MIIFTCASGREQTALNEIRRIDNNLSDFLHIASGVSLIKTSMDFESFFNIYKKDMPIFIRHIFPVMYEGNADAARNINIEIPENKDFSVQTRSYKTDIKPYDINNSISEALVNQGHILNVKNPEIIISVVISGDRFYAGISTPQQNLSKWAGGEPEYKRDENMVSRAERKLLEAFEVFSVNLPMSGKALDLGAAPGGWSRILADKGFEVCAVDPAMLSSNLPENIQHEKKTAEVYFKEIMKSGKKFDIIVNDMKMDFNQSIDIMIMAKSFLASGGLCILTLKLPEKNQQKNAQKAVAVLKKHFSKVAARQLFHNRSEVTVVIKD